MINQNITFHLPKYNSNMFCVLKVITDKLTLHAMPYHVFRHLSAITAVRPKPNDVRCAYQISWWLTPQAGGRARGKGGGAEGGGKGGAEGRQKILPGGQN